MKDRDLPAEVVRRAFAHLGCEAYFDHGFIVVIRKLEGRVLVSKQHLHKGRRDILRRGTLRTMYKHQLGFSPEEFYSVVDAVR